MTEYRTEAVNASDSLIRLKFKSPSAPECYMTLRNAGSMGRNTEEETPERKKILRELNAADLFTLKQCHSRHVFNAENIQKNSFQEGDGLFTYRKDIKLAVTIADCMPLFFYGQDDDVFGVLHSGWKGTGISLEALKMIKGDLNNNFSSYEFILGPSIGACCYQVDEERGRLFKDLFGSDTVVRKREKNNLRSSKNCLGKDFESDNYSYYIDLRKANVNLLEKAGIKNITVIENCTCCSDNFYSFRGDGEKQFRLMLALIGYFR